MDLNTRVEKSYELIREFAEKWSGVYIAFSGGKDSTALLLLAAEALPTRLIRGVVYVEVTGNTDRCNIDYAYRVVEKLGLREKLVHLRREDMGFFDALVRWGVPGRTARWCWNEFKVSQFQRVRPPVFLAGVKRSDSRFRALSGWGAVKKMHGMFVLSPIYEWSTEDVLGYVRSRNIELSPCYERFGHSGNCVFCPFRTRTEVMKTVADPYWGPKILSALSQLRNEKGRAEYRRWARYITKPLTKWMR